MTKSKPFRSVSIVGLPFDEQSSYLRGAASGPQAIREAFRCDSSNTWCEAGFDLHNHPSIAELGDVQPGEDSAATRRSIESTVRRAAEQGQRILALGGDHAVTYPVLCGLRHVYQSITVLHLDAHPDLYDELDGNRFSHATPMARALEGGTIDRLVQIGIRTMNGQQQAQADRFDVQVIPMSEWACDMSFDDLPINFPGSPQNGLPNELIGPVYLSLDIDVLDPAFAPGVSHHEPGGCSTRQLIRLIHSLDVNLIGADIVELNPARDLQGVTAMVAAKLMKELLAKLIVG